MECYRARELIQEKLARKLDAGLAQALAGHLAGCPGCRAFESGMGALDSLMSGEPLEDAPEGFAARVRQAASRRRRKALSFERRNLRIAAACVAAALLLVAFVPFFVGLPPAEELTGRLASIAPPVPGSAPGLAEALEGIESSWDSVSRIEIPAFGLTGALMALLGALAAAMVMAEAVYFALPYRRKR